MPELISLEVVDVDGAIREAEAGVAGDTRADFFRKGAIGGSAVLGGGVLLGGFPELADAKRSKKNDIKILNFALTLEYLEAEFYKEAVAKGALSGDVLAAAKIVKAHEVAHVAFLKDALGMKAVAKPKFDFKDTTSDPVKFLATAVALEDTGVKAYSGQAAKIKQASILKAAASILTVEARHASRFRSLNGQNFAPRAFDRRATKKQTLKTVEDTGFITG